MGTSANINVKVGDVYHTATVNYDGYPSFVGYILYHYYNTQEIAELLVSKGDFSGLTEIITHVEYYNDGSDMRISTEREEDESYSYTFDDGIWYITGHEYDENDNLNEWNYCLLANALGMATAVAETSSVDESSEVFKYFGCSISEVIAINEEWLVQYNTNDPRMTDSYNDRQRWSIRHREAPYQGMDEDGIWHHTFFGRTLYEAVTKANEYLKRGKEFEADKRI
jgi:hypothetical protein